MNPQTSARREVTNSLMDNGAMNAEGKDGRFAKHTQENSLFKAQSGKEKVNVLQNSERGNNFARRMRSECNQQLGGEKSFPCEVGFSYPKHSNLHIGIPKVELLDNTDPECGSNLSYVKHITYQLSTKLNRAQYACFECKKIFCGKVSHTRHLRTHVGVRPHQCSKCEKCFSVKQSLIIHLRKHSGERPFQCTDCEKSFRTKAYLTIHLRTHSGERPFQCNECKKCFIQKADLNRHLRIHSGDRPYHCTECGESFIRKGHLLGHQRVHTETSTVNSMAHDNNLSVQSYFNEHQRIHSSGERQKECTECEKSFEQMDDHSSHHRTCTQCEKVCANNTHDIIQHTGERTRKTQLIRARLLEISIPNDYFILRHGEGVFKSLKT